MQLTTFGFSESLNGGCAIFRTAFEAYPPSLPFSAQGLEQDFMETIP